jgi:hypothetical protein
MDADMKILELVANSLGAFFRRVPGETSTGVAEEV